MLLRRFKLSSVLAITVFFALNCLATGSPELYRGYAAINQKLHERLLLPTAPVLLGDYLGETWSETKPTLLDLLGSYKGTDLDSKIQNASPNPVNTLLYFVAFDGLSQDIASLCSNLTSKFATSTNESFLTLVNPICQNQVPADQWPAVLQSVWLTLMVYDAPYDEFNEWSQRMQLAINDGVKGGDLLALMTSTIFNNPYFLLGLN